MAQVLIIDLLWWFQVLLICNDLYSAENNFDSYLCLLHSSKTLITSLIPKAQKTHWYHPFQTLYPPPPDVMTIIEPCEHSHETTNQARYIHRLCKSDSHNNHKCCITLFIFCYTNYKSSSSFEICLPLTKLWIYKPKCSNWVGHLTALWVLNPYNK